MKTQKKTVTVTHEDLDKALALPWNVQTCLLAQAGKRQKIEGGPLLDRLWSAETTVLMDMFDDYHRPNWLGSKGPMLLAMLEAVLPMEFEVEVMK
jgi:hypothetical protein